MAKDSDPGDPIAKPQSDAILRHELLTPLSGIIGIAELLLQSTQGRDRRYVEGLLAAARGMVPVVERVGSIDAKDAGSKTPLDLGKVLTGLAGFAEARAAAHNLKADIRLDGPFPVIEYDTAHLLQQILVNLIDNAVKYTEEGQISLTATCRAKPDYYRLKIAVSDTGRGIAPEDIETIRHTGQRGTGAEDRKGSGIGLGVASEALEELGGGLDIESMLGKGSTFTISLPIHAVAVDGDADSETAEKPVNSGAKVLIVDDNRLNRLLVSEILDRLGYITSQASGGEDALDRLSRHEFDAVLMDIEMPDMSGIEVTQKIRAELPNYAGTPIIALTAHGKDQGRAAASSDLFADIVAKPIDPAALDSALRLAVMQARKKAS